MSSAPGTPSALKRGRSSKLTQGRSSVSHHGRNGSGKYVGQADDAASEIRGGNILAQTLLSRKFSSKESAIRPEKYDHIDRGLEEEIKDTNFLINALFVANYSSTFQNNWILIVFICNAYNIFTVLFWLGIAGRPTGFWLLVEILVEVLLVFDFLSRFIIKSYFPSIWKHMIVLNEDFRGSGFWFYLPLALASVPYTLIQEMTYHWIVSYDRDMFGIACIQLPKLLRYVQLSSYFTILELVYLLGRKTYIKIIILKMTKALLGLLLAQHFAACLWLVTGRLEPNDHHTWMDDVNLHAGTLAEQYIDATFWAVCTMTSIGFGDMYPHTNIEIIVALFVMIMGASVYGDLFAEFVTIIDEANHHKIETKEKFEKCKKLARRRELSNPLKDRIVQYYTHVKEKYDTKEYELVKDLPVSLRTELLMKINESLIQKVMLFHLSDPSFILAIVRHLRTRVCLSGDYVVYRGEIAEAFYIVKSGFVRVLATDERTIIAVMGEGTYFGEIGLLLTKKRSVSVKAGDVAQLGVVPKREFIEIMDAFQQQKEFLERVARQRHMVTQAPPVDDEDGAPTGYIPAASHNYRDHVADNDSAKRMILHPKARIYIEQDDTQPRKTLYAETSLMQESGVIHPLETKGICWSIIVLMAMSYSHFYVPYSIAFEYQAQGVFLALDIISLLIYAFDIYVRSRTAVLKDGFYETDRSRILHRYFDQEFYLDLIAALPIDHLIWAMGGSHITRALFRLLRLLKTKRGAQILIFIQNQSEKSMPLYTLSVFFIIFIYLCHYTVCMMILINKWEDGEDRRYDGRTMIGDFGTNDWFQPETTPFDTFEPHEQYINWLYWSYATCGTVAYGDIIPATYIEKLFAILIMLVAKVFTAFIYAEASSVVSSFHQAYSDHVNKVRKVQKWMQHAKLPIELRSRVRRFYDIVWDKYQGMQDQEIMDSLPYSLRTDISVFIFKDFIEKSQIFPKDDIAVIVSIVRRLKVLLISQDEYIVREGELANEMYFILEGTVEIVLPNGKVAATLGQGMSFGEMALANGKPSLRNADVIATENVVAAILKLEDCNLICQSYPKFDENLKNLVKTREEENRKKEEAEDGMRKHSFDSQDSNSMKPIRNLPSWTTKLADLSRKSSENSSSEIHAGPRLASEDSSKKLDVKGRQEALEEIKENARERRWSGLAELSRNDLSSEEEMPEMNQDTGRDEVVPFHEAQKNSSAASSSSKRQKNKIFLPRLRNSLANSSQKLDDNTTQNGTNPSSTSGRRQSRLSQETATNKRSSRRQSLNSSNNGGMSSPVSRENNAGSHSGLDIEKQEFITEFKKKMKTTQVEQGYLASATSRGGGRRSIVQWLKVCWLVRAVTGCLGYLREKSGKEIVMAVITSSKMRMCMIAMVAFYNHAFIPLHVAFDIKFKGFYLAMEIVTVAIYSCDIIRCTYAYLKKSNDRVYPLGFGDDLDSSDEMDSDAIQAALRRRKGSRQSEGLLATGWIGGHVNEFVSLIYLLYLVIVTLPFGLILDLAGVEGPMMLVLIFNFLRIVRFQEMYGVLYIMKKKHNTLVRILEVLFSYLLLFHVSGCIWARIGFIETDPRESWFRRIPTPREGGRRGIDDPPLSDRDIYVHSIYWAVVTISHIGVGDITATTVNERAFNSFMILIGTFSYSILFGNMASLVADLAPKLRSKFQHQFKRVNALTKSKKFPDRMYKKIRSYFDAIWEKNKGYDELAILSEMPDQLKSDILFFRYQIAIRRSEFFKQPDSDEIDRALTNSILRYASFKTFMPNDFIIHAGSLTTNVYVLLSGRAYVIGIHNQLVATLKSGDYTGEMTFAEGVNARRTANVIAGVMCHVIELSRDHVILLKSAYPRWASKIREAYIDRKIVALNIYNDDELKNKNEIIKKLSGYYDQNDKEWKDDRSTGSTFSSHFTDAKFKKASNKFLKNLKEDGEPDSGLMLSPESTFKFVWDSFHALLLLYSTIVIPLQVGLSLEISGFILVMEIITLIESVFFIVVNFRTEVTVNGKASRRFSDIYANYRENGLFYDVIATNPLNLILGLMKVSDPLLVIAGLRVIRLISAARILALLDNIEIRFRSLETVLAIFKTILFFFYLWHWSACVWFFINTKVEDEDVFTWYDYNQIEKKRFSEQYLYAIYFVMNIVTSVGYGDMFGTTDLEKLTTIFIILIGDALFAVAFGMLASISMESRDDDEVYLQIKTQSEFFEKFEVPKSLGQRIEQYHAYMWALKNLKDTAQGINELYDYLPEKLVDDFIYLLNKKFLSRVTFIQKNESPNFLYDLTLKLKSEVYLPNDYIIYKDDIGNEMYFLAEGQVKLFDRAKRPNPAFFMVNSGSYFGEMALLLKMPRSLSAVATTFCYLLVLTKDDLDDILKSFPRIAQGLNKEAERRLKELEEKKKPLDEIDSDDDEVELLTPGQELFSQNATPLSRILSEIESVEARSRHDSRSEASVLPDEDASIRGSRRSSAQKGSFARPPALMDFPRLVPDESTLGKRQKRRKGTKKERRLSRLGLEKQLALSNRAELTLRWNIDTTKYNQPMLLQLGF